MTEQAFQIIVWSLGVLIALVTGFGAFVIREFNRRLISLEEDFRQFSINVAKMDEAHRNALRLVRSLQWTVTRIENACVMICGPERRHRTGFEAHIDKGDDGEDVIERGRRKGEP